MAKTGSRNKSGPVRRIIVGIGTIGFVLVAIALLLVLWNNLPAAGPDRSELAASQDRAIAWLVDNRDEIIKQDRPVLWWMVKRSAEISGSPVLTELLESFKVRAFAPGYFNNWPWRPLFDIPADLELKTNQLLQLPDYNLLILFGLSCQFELAQLDVIREQQQINFCRKHHPVSPACSTHQLLGLLFVEDSGCMDAVELDRLKSALQVRIRRQLSWDPRVLDVYAQRLLLLADSGARNRIKPVWLRRMLDTQCDDGGWGNFDPLLPVGNAKYLGFSGRGIRVRAARGNFHNTAQGLLLTTLLLAGEES